MNKLDKIYEPHDNEPYMSDAQIDYFRDKLLHWRNLIAREMVNCRSELSRNPDEYGDIVDRSVAVLAQQMALLGSDRTQKIIKGINAALGRIEAGSYGYCLHTGEEIGLKRLIAWPIATLSVEAQEALEFRMKR